MKGFLPHKILQWLVLAWLAAATGVQAGQWTQWRGPNLNGTTPERLVPPGGSVPDLSRVAWQRNVGEGCGSVVVLSNHVFTTGWQAGIETIFCLDVADGRVVWSQSYACPRHGRHAVGDQGAYSGPTATPTLDVTTGLLYTLGTDGDLQCWDTAREGARVWAINLYDRYRVERRPDVGGDQRDYGFTTAPLISDGDLLVAVGQNAGLVVAFDKRTGQQRWASACKDFASNCGGLTPIRVNQLPCLAVLSLERLVVMRLDKGHEGATLATYPWKTDFANNLVTPTVVGAGVFLSSGYNLSKSALVEVTSQGIVPKWESKHFTGVCSPVPHAGKLYLAYNELRCINSADGTAVWRGPHVGADGSCLVTGDEYLIVFGKGRLVIAETAARSPAGYRELARRDNICQPNNSWPHVVLANGRIYCKDRRGNITCLPVAGDER